MKFNFVLAAAVLILLLSIVRGGMRGFLKSCLSLAALVLAGILVMAFNPFVTRFLRDATGLDEWIGAKVQSAVYERLMPDTDTEDGVIVLEQDVTVPADITLPDGTVIPAGTVLPKGTELPAGEAIDELLGLADEGLSVAEESGIIESLPIPQGLKNSLQANNNSAVYAQMGVERFSDYIGSFISSVCLSIIGYAATFLLVFFALHILMLVFNVVDRLPVIHGINHFAGALLGIVKGLIIIELLLLILIPFTVSQWGADILAQVESSRIMSFLYEKNILVTFLMRIVGAGV